MSEVTMDQLERNVLEDFRDRIRWRIDNMPLDELRGFADEDGDLDLSDLVADLIDTVQHEGEDHECVDGCVPVYYHQQADALASRPGIGGNLELHLGGPVAADLWANIAACIYYELSDHLSSHMEGEIEELVTTKWPSLNIGPEVVA